MTLSTYSNYFLAGDIGATKTSLAIFPHGSEPLEPIAQETVNNNTASSLEEIIETFLTRSNLKPVEACLGVAGPVTANLAQMTNLDWTVDGRALQQKFGMQSVTLINDLVATAFGAVHLPRESLCPINPGQSDPTGAVAVIAPGTGLGEAFLVRHHGKWRPIPSEGGHSSFAPTNAQQRKLLQFMSGQHNHISTEMVCSGIGIPNLYNFLCIEKGKKKYFYDAPAKIVIEMALAALDKNEENNTALQTMKLFAAILASEAANLTLKVLASGGLYIGGGIPPRILPFLQAQEFMHSFCKGEYAEMLTSVPVHVILEPKTALLGAAAYGRTQSTAFGDTA